MARVGWFVQSDISSHIFFDPKGLPEYRPTNRSHKSVQSCPAVADYERQRWVIRSPYSIYLKINKNEDIFEFWIDFEKTSLNRSTFERIVYFQNREEWRYPNKPVIQFEIPYTFVSDDNVYINQSNTDLQENRSWNVISGRFPIRDWIRPLSFAIEITSIPIDIVIKRGDPIYEIFFESEYPNKKLNLVRIDETESIKIFSASCRGVVGKIDNSFSAIQIAKTRRPAVLLPGDKDEKTG